MTKHQRSSEHNALQQNGNRARSPTLAIQEDRRANFQVAVRTRGSVLQTIQVESDDLKGLRIEVARFVGSCFEIMQS